jgi:predicted RNase H-like HicB family nuclease
MEIKVNVLISKVDNTYFAYCPEYNLTAKAITVEEALADLQRLVTEYLETEQPSLRASVVFVTSFHFPV